MEYDVFSTASFCGCEAVEFCARCQPREVWKIYVEQWVSSMHTARALHGVPTEKEIAESEATALALPDTHPERVRRMLGLE